MYGLVNRAIEGLVRQQFGDDTWNRIRSRAGIGDAGFLAMQAYPDHVTYHLVGAASEELGLTTERILEAFGEYWTRYTIDQGYGHLVTMMGTSFEEFLDNLDSLHARIKLSMPELVPPSLEREALPDGSSILHYESQREGLAPMVVGLLRGLARRFDVGLEIEQLGPGKDGRLRFHLRTRDGSAAS